MSATITMNSIASKSDMSHMLNASLDQKSLASETCAGIGRGHKTPDNSPHDQCGHFAVREDFIGLAAEYQTP